ncbi:MAG: alpha/beta fold hydrolase, partial [Caldilineae bacterium]
RSVPTPTPLPRQLREKLDLQRQLLVEINSALGMYGREDVDRREIDKTLRRLIPTVEALTRDLQNAGVEVPNPILPPTPPVQAEVEVFDIGMVTEDKVQIQGTYYSPGVVGAPGILLLHMLGGQRSDWEELARALQAQGYGVLAIDLRGHGQSGGERDYTRMIRDAKIGVTYLRAREEIDDGRLVIMGASIGANIALNYAARDPAIAAAVLLSPGLDYHGVTTEEAVQEYGDRPLLIVASEEDAYAAESARRLATLAPSVELIMLQGQGHGTGMLGRENGLEERLFGWLAEVTAK